MSDMAVEYTLEPVKPETTRKIDGEYDNSFITDFKGSPYKDEDSFSKSQRVAKALSSSDLVPDKFQGGSNRAIANTLIALELSYRTKMSPFMVMQNLYIIQGRPSWSSQFLIAMVNACGRFSTELRFEKIKDGDDYGYRCYVKAKDGEILEGSPVMMSLAIGEGWLNKHGSKWKTMPDLMLRYRAAAFFARQYCPDLLLGLYSEFEQHDIINQRD